MKKLGSDVGAVGPRYGVADRVDEELFEGTQIPKWFEHFSKELGLKIYLSDDPVPKSQSEDVTTDVFGFQNVIIQNLLQRLDSLERFMFP